LSKHLKGLPWKLLRRSLITQSIIVTIILGLALLFCTQLLEKYVIKQNFEEMEVIAHATTDAFLAHPENTSVWCLQIPKNQNYRYTLINSQGEVLCDNFLSSTELDNHLTRPEFSEAIQSGLGTSIRYSINLRREMIYLALKVNDSYVLRMGKDKALLDQNVIYLRRFMMNFIIPICILLSLITIWFSFRIAFPLRSVLLKLRELKHLPQLANDNFFLTDLDQNGDLNDDWGLIEQSLEKASIDAKLALNKLYQENKKIITIIESITDAVIAIDIDEKILFVNSHFLKMFQITSKNTLVGQKYYEFLREHEVQEKMNEVLKTGTPKKVYNHVFQVSDNEQIFADLIATPLKDQNENTYGMVCLFHNVQERMLADKMRENFVSNVSHELRTPLTSIKGSAQLLKETFKAGAAANELTPKLIEKIDDNCTRLLQLFNDILKLSELESTGDITQELFSTEQLLEQVLSSMRHLHPQHPHKIHTQIETKTAWGDKSLIEQMLINLVENAIKYTEGAGDIFIQFKKIEEGCEITVRNTPSFIAKDHLIRLFERFYRVDPSRSREIKGTGLGLSIVKHIALKHHGKVQVQSNQTDGTTFTFSIPQKF
jgi:two-component system phosphate regulon sensor histidine kinase PhoR